LSKKQDKRDVFSSQVLHSISIGKLKCINGLKEIDFSPNSVTAILGPNGSGKSTILHAIACLYKPFHNDPENEKLTVGENHRLVDFFPASPDGEWNGSNFSATMSYRKAQVVTDRKTLPYGKGEPAGSRWLEIYARRPEREVYYLGIDKCVPMIESEKKGKVKYVTSSLSDNISNLVRVNASSILNKEYSSLNNHIQPNGKEMIGVECDGVSYSSLSMSAGEQKIFQILNVVFNAGKNSLILIDEIDLLLHDAAFKKLIKVIKERADDKKIQVVFTTHRESIINMSNIVNIRHVLNVGNRTYCFSESKPDAIDRLTGDRSSSVEIYVEDDVAASVLRKVCSSMQASKHVKIIRYGAAINAFTLVSAALLKGDNLNNALYVLDGDEYISEDAKKKCIERVLTGDDQHAIDLRSTAMEHIRQFNIPDKYNPEKFIHSIIKELDASVHDGDAAEIIEAAKSVIYEKDSHDYLDQVIVKLGLDRSSALTRMIDLASKSDKWEHFVADVNAYLKPILDALLEHRE
jgi:AAA15 family ATPase/GTPase